MLTLDLPDPPWIVGHRGVRGPLPENTVASVLEAVAQGADMVEIDLQLTAGDELVVHHDAVVRNDSGEQIQVSRMSRRDRRRWRPVWEGRDRRIGYEIPTLQEVLAAAPADLPFNLEIKRHDLRPDVAALVEALLQAIADRPGILVSSFCWKTLAAVRERHPGLPLAPLAGQAAEWGEALAAARRLAAFSIHISHRLATRLGDEGVLATPAARERPILAYTVNRANLARRLLDLGIAGFFSDRPAELRARLAGAGTALQ